MRIDEDVVTRDIGEAGGDVADASHIGGQAVDVIDAAGGLKTIGPLPQIEQLEVVGVRGLELRLFEIGAAHPIAFELEPLHQVVADEPSGPGN